jgi:hypothetical protein
MELNKSIDRVYMPDYDRIFPLQTTNLVLRNNRPRAKGVCKCGRL